MKTSLSKSKSGDLFLPLIEEVQGYRTFFGELCLIMTGLGQISPRRSEARVRLVPAGGGAAVCLCGAGW